MNFFKDKINDDDFRINAEAFLKVYKESFRLKILLDFGAYIYVEEVICLNQSKYITFNAQGNPSLTPYAQNHLPECCIEISELRVSYSLNESIFRQDKISFILTFGKGGEIEKEAVSKQVTQLTEVMKGMPNTFGEALKYLMKWQDVRNEELAEYSMIAVETISRMRSRPDYEPKLKSVIAICIALNLPPMLSSKLVELAGYNLRYTSEEQMFYSVLLAGSSSFTVEDCNELLKENGYSVLV